MLKNKTIYTVLLLFLVGIVPYSLYAEDGPKLIHIIDDDTIEVNINVDNSDSMLHGQRFLNVYDFGGDDWKEIWRPRISLPSRVENVMVKSSSDSTDANGEVVIKYKRVRGFRVQLANVLGEDQASMIEKKAKALFENIYVTFHAPNYRVRAGDFQRRSEADKAAAEAKRMGFRGAWVVPDRVNVPE